MDFIELAELGGYLPPPSKRAVAKVRALNQALALLKNEWHAPRALIDETRNEGLAAIRREMFQDALAEQDRAAEQIAAARAKWQREQEQDIPRATYRLQRLQAHYGAMSAKELIEEADNYANGRTDSLGLDEIDVLVGSLRGLNDEKAELVRAHAGANGDTEPWLRTPEGAKAAASLKASEAMKTGIVNIDERGRMSAHDLTEMVEE